MYQLTIKVAKKEKDYYEELLFGMEALSISSSETVDYYIITAHFESLLTINKAFLPPDLDLKEIGDGDWKYKWLEKQSGIAISDTIYVQPVTENGYSQKFEYDNYMLVDPRFSFGDGHHPTTKMCMILLENILNKIDNSERKTLSLVDVGCGSGLLSMLADMMGIGSIDAFDIEADAVDSTKQNCKMNFCLKVNAFESDISDYHSEKKYDIVCANLLTAVIIEHVENLCMLLNNKGVMIVSGVSTIWNDEIMNIFASNGLSVREHFTEEGWCSYLLSIK